jgi:predicted neuraminidase
MKKNSLWILTFGAVALIALGSSCKTANDNKNVQKMNLSLDIKGEFIFPIEGRPTPNCHASTIAQAQDGSLIAAWFGGTKEKNKDVTIWVSHCEEGRWSKPVEVADGKQNDGSRYPCWNPVLFQPAGGPLMLFYKVGPNPEQWWGMFKTSENCGKTWSSPQKLPHNILGPIKNKPIQLSNGDLLCPSSTEPNGWKVHLEQTSDLGKTWSIVNVLNDPTIRAIQPSILTYKDGKMQMLCRTENGFISQCWSDDNGKSWGKMTATSLPNPNSGIDAVTMKDGRQLLVYNPTSDGARVPLSIAVSNDGKNWKRICDLEGLTKSNASDEYSYPAVIQTTDGVIHIVYTYNRQTIKHVILNPPK